MVEREGERAVQAEATRERIAQLTAQFDELDRAAEEVRITRTTLLELPGPQLSAPSAPKLAEHPVYQQIWAVFTAAEHPLLARQCVNLGRHRSARSARRPYAPGRRLQQRVQQPDSGEQG